MEPDDSQTTTGLQATTTYTYDALNHLIGVSMPRQMPSGSTVTQTRTFSYGTPPGAYLWSATNPESGTVNYTYNLDGTLATKWDAIGQQYGYFLQYLYDAYGRVTTVQTVPGTPSNPSTPPSVIRTYTYDTNASDDPTYSQNGWGRPTRVQYSTYAAAQSPDYFNNNMITFSPDSVTEMYSYNPAGEVIGKRMRVQRTGDQPSSNPSVDLNATWTYNNEGNLTGTSYPGDPNSYPVPPIYGYTYDGMGRLAGMTQTNTYTTLVSGVSVQGRRARTRRPGDNRVADTDFSATPFRGSGRRRRHHP